MGTLRERMKQQQGEVMLEASIILVSVILLLMALLSLSFLFYQQSLMNTVACKESKYNDSNREHVGCSLLGASGLA